MSFSNTHTDILLAGAAAAFTIDLLVYPLDTIKTRIQSPDYKRIYTIASANGSHTVNRALFRGLYQGVGSVILATVPSSGAFFTTYEATKAGLIRLNSSLLPGNLQLPTPMLHSAASCAGELVSCFILTPAEVLKQNAQMISRPQDGRSHAFDATATRQAFAKFKQPWQLWRGYGALVGRNLPFTAMQFPLYEHFKALLLERRKLRGTYTGSLAEKGMVTAAAAGGAGSLAAWITTPVDVVKTRIMLSAAGDGETDKQKAGVAKNTVEGAKSKAGRLKGLAVARQVVAEGGIKGLFRGAALRGAWTALGSGLYLSIYESGRTYLENRRTNKTNEVFSG